MRQSTTFGPLPGWQHALRARLRPDPYGPLAPVRRGQVARVVTQIQASGRVPRVCLYALAVMGQEPSDSLAAAAVFAEREGWRVEVEQRFADDQPATPPTARAGWRGVREQIELGHADGVVVVNPAVISLDVAAYRQELSWLEQHSAFLALVVPEMQT